jgi:hypothetical protein
MSVETDYHARRELDAQLAAEAQVPDRLAALERIRAAAQFYIDAPQKFGIRRSAFRSLLAALDAERDARQATTHLPLLGTMDDVAAIEEIMSISSIEADTLEDANIRLDRIFQLASERLKGDDRA